ncbi:molybdopterin cofactor-binding domain-containing protein [candidate division KSB1 bacterium]
MSSDEYPNIEFKDPHEFTSFKRRDFLKTIGGGIAILFTIGDPRYLLAQRGSQYPTDFNAYFLIKEDGIIDLYSGKIEMGQGAVTSLSQTAAEELDVALDRINIIMGDTDLCPFDSGTYGSLTTRFFHPPVKAAAASAKAVLMELASENLNVPESRLIADNGTIYERGRRNNSVTYGQLAKGQKITHTLSKEAVEKAVSEFKVLGKPTLRIDSREKVTGRAKFAGDIRFPDMLYAKILRPPAHRAELKSVDVSEAEKVKDITIVNEDGLVAALHRDPEEASKALDMIKAEFDIPDEEVDDKTIFDHLLNNAPDGREYDKTGDLAAGEQQSSEIMEETYYNSYVAHAPIETHTATADYRDGKIEIWISSQSPFGDQRSISRNMDMPPEDVRVRTPFVGGGFGGKTSNRQAAEAARLSKITGKPVQVFWTRAEEFFYDTYRPAAVVKVKSGINDSGRIVLWDYRGYFEGRRGSDQHYDIPNNLITIYGEWMRTIPGTHPFSVGAWRAPGCNTNVFARESHIDVTAAKAGIDPLEFRLNNTKDKRMIGVLRAVADKFGWTPQTKFPSGRGYGIACGIDAETYQATIAAVTVNERTGAITVDRIVCAQDMGLCVNPQGSTIQMEGCLTMGLGYALTEEIHFKGGRILDTNFDTYELPRFSWLPKIETVIVESEVEAPKGGGEPAIIAVGGVLANAVYDACGARLYQLPMTPERVREALSKR